MDVLLEVAVRPRGRTHRGDLSEVGSEGGEVTSAQGSVVHRLAACVGCEGEVGCNPTDGGDESSHAGRATHRRVVWALQAVVVNGLVQEHNGLVQVGGRLDHVDDALRADPGQLLGLGVIEEVLQVAQGLLMPQALSFLDDLVDARDVFPVLHLLHADRMLGTKGQGRRGHGFSQPHHRQHRQHPGSGQVPTGLAGRALGRLDKDFLRLILRDIEAKLSLSVHGAPRTRMRAVAAILGNSCLAKLMADSM